MTKMIEGLRQLAYEQHISEELFGRRLAQSVQDNPEPPPSMGLTAYFRWNALIVTTLCEAFPNELR